MARAYIRGYQGDDLSLPTSVAASVKHFAAYGAAEAGREYNTTDMSESRLQQDYLPPYKAAVEAGAATIMSAFNSLMASQRRRTDTCCRMYCAIAGDSTGSW